MHKVKDTFQTATILFHIVHLIFDGKCSIFKSVFAVNHHVDFVSTFLVHRGHCQHSNETNMLKNILEKIAQIILFPMSPPLFGIVISMKSQTSKHQFADTATCILVLNFKYTTPLAVARVMETNHDSNTLHF